MGIGNLPRTGLRAGRGALQRAGETGVGRSVRAAASRRSGLGFRAPRNSPLINNPVTSLVAPVAGYAALDRFVIGPVLYPEFYGDGETDPGLQQMPAPGYMPGTTGMDYSTALPQMPDAQAMEREIERQQRSQFYSALYEQALTQAEAQRGNIEQLQTDMASAMTSGTPRMDYSQAMGMLQSYYSQ